ncbi:MAG: glycosyltransferase family 39 protein, partial [Acidobacteriota bacterium]
MVIGIRAPERVLPAYGTALSIALTVVAVSALLVRCASIAEPLGIDQSLWASAVRGMSRGQLLYRDVWEQRPPGIYFLYLSAFRIFGWTPSAVAWLDVLASAATTLLLYAIAARLGSRLTGALAAALYAALTMPAWLYRNSGFLERSVCETFIVACVSASVWCAVRFRESGSLVLAAGVGLFAGAAVVLKPNAGLYFPAILLWIAIYRHPHATPEHAGVGMPPASTATRARSAVIEPRATNDRFGGLIRPFLTSAFAAGVLPAITLAWLWRLGLLHDARVAVVEFNRFYVAQGFTLGGYAVDFSKAVWLRVKTDPLWLAGAAGWLALGW